MPTRLLLASPILLLALVMTSVAADLTVRVRDSRTGAAIRANVWTGPRNTTALTGEAGSTNVSMAAGDNRLEISAKGYRTLSTYFENTGTDLNVTFWLDPMQLPVELETTSTGGKRGSGVLNGYVIDVDSGQPVSGARVYLSSLRISTRSDTRGYFKLEVPESSLEHKGDLPPTDDLVAEIGGSVVYRKSGIALLKGISAFVIDADRDGQTADGLHKLMLNADELGRTQSGGEPIALFESLRSYSSPSAVVVPSSIRVGFGCPTKTTCSSVQVFSLDTYTRLGLDDEWFSSWNTNSLKAGAIANRSYGVWHIYNPLHANYDICNTTSCQVIDPNDSAASTDLATAQTTGTIVVNSARTGPFFAEYSAENNNGGCGDGFTGNGTSWPCMADPVDAGSTFNGHGRGMCQWGTQRWAINQGKDFVWITNHYYNGNGNPSGLRTGVLQMSANTVLPPPTLASPGSSTAPGPAISTTTPTFTWEPVAGADGYSLYISRFNGTAYELIFNSETVVGQPLTGTTFTVPEGYLQPGQQYRWNMSAHNAAGYGTPNTFRNHFTLNRQVSVSGRVVSPSGAPVRSAVVSLRDSGGNIRRVITSSFGLFSFSNVWTGDTYNALVSSKRYRFSSRSFAVNDPVTDLEFVGTE
jgi:hypothetical protein